MRVDEGTEAVEERRLSVKSWERGGNRRERGEPEQRPGSFGTFVDSKEKTEGRKLE